jgi:drug/metabolite transporter (DMT)-like permease
MNGNHPPGTIRVHLLLLFSTTIVSTSFIVAELITESLDPMVLTFVRFLLAALILLPLVAFRWGLKINLAVFLRYGCISACLVVFFWSMFMSLRFTSSLNISVLFTLVPVISALYASLINRERIIRSLMLALVTGLVGAVWVIFRGDLGLLAALAWNRGDLIFFGGCLAMALYTPLIRLVQRGEPLEVMTFWVLVSGCLWMLPVTVYKLGSVSLAETGPDVWLWIAYLALFSTVVSFYITQYATKIIGPTRTISYSYLYPLLVMLLNFLLGHGWPPLRVIPGIVLSLAAMLLLVHSSRGRDVESAASG